jgi:hypothetical protein
LETVKKKIKKWLVREDSFHQRNTIQEGNGSQPKERKRKRLEEKEFEYLISQEAVRKKFKLWLIRKESYYQIWKNQKQSYYQIPENPQVYKIIHLIDQKNQNEEEKEEKRKEGLY